MREEEKSEGKRASRIGKPMCCQGHDANDDVGVGRLDKERFGHENSDPNLSEHFCLFTLHGGKRRPIAAPSHDPPSLPRYLG
jgi:hypothetical protein